MKYFSVLTFRIQPKSHLPPLKVSSELTEAKLQLTCVCGCECVCVCVGVCVCELCNCVALFFVANLPKVRTHRQSQRTLTPPNTPDCAVSAESDKAIRSLSPSPSPNTGCCLYTLLLLLLLLSLLILLVFAVRRCRCCCWRCQLFRFFCQYAAARHVDAS